MPTDTTAPMSCEIPDCHYQNDAVLIKPDKLTPNHTLQLSNLDSQKFLRFSIKYLYLFVNAVPVDSLKSSLAAALSHYYPLAGRLRAVRSDAPNNDDDDDHSRLEVECNGEGAVFAEASMDYTADEFLAVSSKPNRSWRKLLYRVEANTFLDVPPLVVQVTKLSCGGMILCTAINHSVCDGIGTSQFLTAWAHLTTKPTSNLPIQPFHTRHVLAARSPPQVTLTHPGFTRSTLHVSTLQLILRSHPLVPTSFTFNPCDLLSLKKHCSPSTKCTSFEALAAHTWRSWVLSLLHVAPTRHVKLLFSVNVRNKTTPRLPKGYYGNGFVLGCTETSVESLVSRKLGYCIGLVQKAKMDVTDECVRSMVDLLEDEKVMTDLASTFVVSQWSRLGLEEVDFGRGKAVHVGSLTSDVYCLFLPVVGDPESVRVSVSVPSCVVDRFESFMRDLDGDQDDQELGYYDPVY